MLLHKNVFLRSFVLFLAAILLTGTLSACGGSSSESNLSAPAAQSSTAASEGTSQPAAGDTASAEPIELSLAYHGAGTSDMATRLNQIADEITKGTDGRVKITCYHGAVLGPALQGLDMLETGVCDIVWTTTGFYPERFPVTDILGIPMLGCTESQTLTKAWWDAYEKDPEAFAPEYEGYYPWIIHASPMNVLTSTKPINSLDDLNGLSIRVIAGPATTVVQKWGANPVSMSPADIYLSMEKGVIDAFLFDLSGINTWTMYEIANNVTNAGISVAPIMILFNADKWGQISPEDQAFINGYGGVEGSLAVEQVLEDEANLTIQTLEKEGQNYRQIVAGDALFDEMKTVADEVAADWVAEKSKDNPKIQEIYDFVIDRIAYYEG
jgi:TRAP-type C4-dicarboxylate transport system substrate-binding protein